ncbi:MAG: hypothetical protein RLZZ403_1458 [Pseudomonadota bacterium]
MSEKTQSEEFDEEDEVEESPGAGDELDIEHLIDDLDKRKRGAPKVGEPAWRRLERLREEKMTAELLSDFNDYEIEGMPEGAGRAGRGAKSGSKRR